MVVPLPATDGAVRTKSDSNAQSWSSLSVHLGHVRGLRDGAIMSKQNGTHQNPPEPKELH